MTNTSRGEPYHNEHMQAEMIDWTMFASKAAAGFTEHRCSLGELATLLANAGPFASKAECPWIKLAKFGDRRSVKGSLRWDGNVLGITGVEGDYDGEVVTPLQAIELLERAGIRGIIYTSPSHRDSAPRWRVLAPLLKEAPPQERALYVARINGALGGILAPESFTLSQSYFYGMVEGSSDHNVWVTFDDPEEGSCIDELHQLDEMAIGRQIAPREAGPAGKISIDLFAEVVASKGRLLKTGDNRRELLKTYIASRSARGLGAGEIRAMVEAVVNEYFDPNDMPDARDLNDIIEHYGRRDGKGSQPADISGLVSRMGTVDPETGEVLPEEPARPIFTRVSDLLNNIQPIQWLVNGYLETDALSMVFGPSGGGKSFVVVDLACSIATGTPWHGAETAQGSVFYIAGEGHNGLTRRFAAWQMARKIKLDESVPLYKSNRAVMMLNAAAALEMSNEVDALARATGQKPAMVVIDTLARNFGDGDENTQKDAGRFIEHIDEYIRRRWNCNVMVVHHSGHDMDRARGSSAFKGAMDQELWVKGAAGKIELNITKMKDAEIPSPKMFAITQVGLGVRDECDVEIMGAYIKIDGNPLMFKVGTTQAGTDITANDVVAAIHSNNGWPGPAAMVAILKITESKLARIMRAMKDSGLAEYKVLGPANKVWELSEKALSEFSLSGGIISSKTTS